MKAKDLIEIMEKWTRKDLIDSWDNTGFQLGYSTREVKKVLLSLDLDRMVVDRAIKEGYQMIINHHPLIFKPLKTITDGDHKEELILDLIKNDIVVYNAHSNLDLVAKGVNDQLGELMGLTNTSILSDPVKEDLGPDKGLEGTYGYGRVGNLEEISLEDLVERVKKELDLDRLIVYGDFEKKIRRLAVCGGSGSDFILNAARKGADAYLTGDIKYHEAQLAHELGLIIIDAGHFHTEKIILPVIRDYLVKEVGDKVEFTVIMESGLPRKIL